MVVTVKGLRIRLEIRLSTQDIFPSKRLIPLSSFQCAEGIKVEGKRDGEKRGGGGGGGRPAGVSRPLHF